MKKTKLLSALTALTLTAVSAVSTVASADDSVFDWLGETKTVGDYTVSIYSKECTILSCNDKTLSEVVIPDYIDGVPVTIVREKVFKDFDNLTSIDFGKNKKKFYYGAFENCDSLVEVTLPEWMDSVNESMFMDCSNLKKVEMTSEKFGWIAGHAFCNCTSLETVILPKESLWENCYLTIGSYAFHNCDSLESLAFPKCFIDNCNVYSYAFNECDNLKSVTVGDVELDLVIGRYELPTEPAESTTEATEPTEQRYLPGDANCDGFVNIADAYTAAMFAVKDEMNFDIELTEVQLTNADVFNTGDGVNASDALKIQQYATGVIDTL